MNIQELSLNDSVKSFSSRDMIFMWAGAMMDGEGCFQILKNGEYYKLHTILQMVNTKAAHKFHELFGGEVYPNFSQNPNGNDSARWVLQKSLKVIEFATKLLPYLFIKEDQARLIIEFGTIYRKRSNNGNDQYTSDEICTLNAIYYQMKELNKRGKHAIV